MIEYSLRKSIFQSNNKLFIHLNINEKWLLTSQFYKKRTQSYEKQNFDRFSCILIIKPKILGVYFLSINLNRCDQPLNPGSSVIRRRPSSKIPRRCGAFGHLLAPPKWSSNIFVEKLKSFRIEKPISETLPFKSTKINEINKDISENMMDGSVQVYNEHRNPENYPSDYTFNQPIYATLNSHQNAQNKFGKLKYYF